ncbi:MAG: MFS transporter [Candidatus Cloacimonetes bacterium]|jgi:UMF1 family MFS transporter|nr:MFS transporter [Candidatus Cloacimonadota bacterium]
MQKIKFTKEKTGWILYDFANSSFVTIIVTVLFSMYFKDIVVGKAELGTALWGRAIGISMLFVAILAPIMGAVADYSHSRKNLLVIFSLATILFTIFLYTIMPNDIIKAMIFFIIANFCFNMANVFYNAFLPDIAEKQEIGRISGISWGIGYLGGLVALLIILPVVKNELDNYLHFRYSFLIVAVFFLIFSLPTFLWLKETPSKNIHKTSYIKMGFKRLFETAKSLKKFKELFKFLISYFLYNDGITVVISFAAIYGSTQFNMSAQEMIFYFILAQPASFLGAIIFGYILDKIGAKKSINITLILWMFVVIGAFLCTSKFQFYLVGISAGFVMGSSQSNSRTMFAQLTPIKKASEFFGFFGVTGRLASIAGPLVYGEISRISGNQKNAIISIISFFVLGFIILQFVDEKKGQKVALSLFND